MLDTLISLTQARLYPELAIEQSDPATSVQEPPCLLSVSTYPFTYSPPPFPPPSHLPYSPIRTFPTPAPPPPPPPPSPQLDYPPRNSHNAQRSHDTHNHAYEISCADIASQLFAPELPPLFLMRNGADGGMEEGFQEGEGGDVGDAGVRLVYLVLARYFILSTNDGRWSKAEVMRERIVREGK